MKRSKPLLHLVLSLCAFLMCAGSAMAQASGGDADTAAIKQFWVNYSAFVEKGDSAGWLSQYDEAGIQMCPDASARTKQELDAQVPGAFKARVDANEVKMSITPIEVVVADTWAYSRGTYTQDFTAKSTGQLTHFDGKFLTIFKKQPNGSWRIFRDCFNSNVPPK